MNRKTNYSEQTTLGMYVGLWDGLHHVYIPGRRKAVTTRHPSFQEMLFHLATRCQTIVDLTFDREVQKKYEDKTLAKRQRMLLAQFTNH